MWAVLDILQKELYPIAAVSMIQGNWITDIRLKIKSLKGKNIYDFGSFLIQKRYRLKGSFKLKFKTQIQPADGCINI